MEMQTDQRERVETLFALILLTAFLGQVDIRPFSEAFRFSLCVPALAFILLYFPSTPAVAYSIIAAVVMIFFRGIISIASEKEASLMLLGMQYVPVLVFYLIFGILFSALKVRQHSGRGVSLFFRLFVCEVLANLAELFVMHWFSALPLERAVFFVVLIGGLRSGATAAVYRLTIYWLERYDRRQHEVRYRRMLLFFANLKTDLFFFRKSMDDIESAMKFSYSLYEKLKGGKLGEEALSVSRRIHEVKKEYQRIIASMEKVLSEEYTENPMRISVLLSLLRTSTENLLAMQNIPIAVSFECQGDWIVRSYYTVISIINNLVINSVEAMADRPGGGIVNIRARMEGGDCVIEVEDNGPGISEDLMDCIFEPGFSTKFDPNTGEMSTGIGLPHVRVIVEKHYGGRIEVFPGLEGTLFRIRIPGERLVEGGDD